MMNPVPMRMNWLLNQFQEVCHIFNLHPLISEPVAAPEPCKLLSLDEQIAKIKSDNILFLRT